MEFRPIGRALSIVATSEVAERSPGVEAAITVSGNNTSRHEKHYETDIKASEKVLVYK